MACSHANLSKKNKNKKQFGWQCNAVNRPTPKSLLRYRKSCTIIRLSTPRLSAFPIIACCAGHCHIHRPPLSSLHVDLSQVLTVILLIHSTRMPSWLLFLLCNEQQWQLPAWWWPCWALQQDYHYTLLDLQVSVQLIIPAVVGRHQLGLMMTVVKPSDPHREHSSVHCAQLRKLLVVADHCRTPTHGVVHSTTSVLYDLLRQKRSVSKYK